MAYTTIDDPEAFFQTQLYTGNGSADHAITLGGDTDMQPDMVWIKNREQETTSDEHYLFDSVRGATKIFPVSDTGAETTDADTLDSFLTDGFQVDADTKVNTNAETYVSFNWKKSANSGIDIVAWDGNGANRNLSHSCGGIPRLMLVKRLDGANNFEVYHGSLGNTHHLYLNETAAAADDADRWNDTTPTSSVFTVGTQIGVNASGSNYIGYIFAPIQGFSKFGIYAGTNNVDGGFVHCGFKPAFVLTKKTTAAAPYMWNNKANGFNGAGGNNSLYPHHASIENSTVRIDLLSNGFKFRHADNDHNSTSLVHLFWAFAEAPFVNSKGVPCNAR